MTSKSKATITITLHDGALPTTTIKGWETIRNRDIERVETSMSLELNRLRRAERVKVKQREKETHVG